MSSYYDTSGGQVRLIPGAGTYLESQAKAQSAYERSKAQLMAQRSQTQIKSGLNKDYQVDPNAQYGSYHQLLQSQGSELNQANEQAQSRGFFGSGLGNQGESALRYGHAVQNLGFKNSLADYESGYQAQMGDLERQRQAEMLGALQQGMDYGVDNEDYTEYDDTVYPPTEQTVFRPPTPTNRTAPLKAAPKPKTMSTKASVAAAAKYGWGGMPAPKPKPKPKPKPIVTNAKHHGSAPRR